MSNSGCGQAGKKAAGRKSVSVKGLVKGDRVDPSLYYDPEIFEAELERIFYNGWVWVGHESEIPNTGDYKTFTIGRQPVIVVRGRNGVINVLENRCRHRAATVCEGEKGNATGFTCPYHSWSYSLDGALRGIPYPDGYTGIADKNDLPLPKLRVETYAGMIFASFNKDVCSLDEFLGPAKPWLDLFMKQGAGYPVKTMGEFKFKFKGNWKIQLENTTDGYHFPVVHKSWLDSIDEETVNLMSFMTNPDCVVRALGNGHSVMVMVPSNVDLDKDDGAPLASCFQEIADQLRKDYPEEQVRRIVRSLRGVGFNLNMFPNVSCSMSFFRVLHPLAVDETEIRHVALGMDGGPDIANEMRMRIHEHFQGPFGFGTPDDSEAWDRVQRGVHAGPNIDILVNRGLNREVTEANGQKVAHCTDESGMREAYNMWNRMMTCDE